MNKPCTIIRGRALYWLAILLALVLAGCASAPTPEPEPAEAAREEPRLPVTEAMVAEIRERYGDAAANRADRWRQLVLAADQYTEREKLEVVNDFFNGAAFVDDFEAWGREDYWATPLEFIVRDAGDCEDFALAKYFTLLNMAVDPERMRLTYCTATTLDQAHMVLSYYPEDSPEPLILDNIDGRIRPAGERLDLVPVYSFNAEHLWLNRDRNHEVRAGSPGNMAPWQHWRGRVESLQVPDLD